LFLSIHSNLCTAATNQDMFSMSHAVATGDLGHAWIMQLPVERCTMHNAACQFDDAKRTMAVGSIPIDSTEIRRNPTTNYPPKLPTLKK
jgi:hypothetical protein